MKEKNGMATYKIKKGDTLTSIAKSYNTTVDSIASANGIKNKNLIYAGDTLNIPDKSVSGGGNISPLVTTKLDTSGAYKVGGTPSYSGGAIISSETKKAADSVEKWRSSKPEYKGSFYGKELESLVSALSGRKFSYDPESDPLARAYREAYMRDARLAGEDALGKAAALTGGYGNSYALSAAQQAYAGQLQDGIKIIPELYKAAYDRYTDEGDSIADQIKLLSSLSDSEFDRYNKMIKNYLSEGRLLTDNYNDLSKEDFDRFIDYAKLLQSAGK